EPAMSNPYLSSLIRATAWPLPVADLVLAEPPARLRPDGRLRQLAGEEQARDEAEHGQAGPPGPQGPPRRSVRSERACPASLRANAHWAGRQRRSLAVARLCPWRKLGSMRTGRYPTATFLSSYVSTV